MAAASQTPSLRRKLPLSRSATTIWPGPRRPFATTSDALSRTSFRTLHGVHSVNFTPRVTFAHGASSQCPQRSKRSQHHNPAISWEGINKQITYTGYVPNFGRHVDGAVGFLPEACGAQAIAVEAGANATAV